MALSAPITLFMLTRNPQAARTSCHTDVNQVDTCREPLIRADNELVFSRSEQLAKRKERAAW